MCFVCQDEVCEGHALRAEKSPSTIHGAHGSCASARLHITSDINWSTSIREIDAQLYVKYGLDADEVAFIESQVTPKE